jgi:ERCC4-type nuclease
MKYQERIQNAITKSFDISTRKAQLLIDAGYIGWEAFVGATDEELLAVEGIGQDTVDKIRAALEG